MCPGSLCPHKRQETITADLNQQHPTASKQNKKKKTPHESFGEMWGMGVFQKTMDMKASLYESTTTRIFTALSPSFESIHTPSPTSTHTHIHTHTHTHTHIHTHMTTLIYLQIVPPNVKCHLFLIQVFKHTLSHTLSLSFFQTHNKHSITHSHKHTLLSFLCSHT